MYVKKLDEIPMESVSAGEKTYKQLLIGPEHGPNFSMRRFCIEPGGSMPRHSNSVEHEQIVLAGEAEICLGDELIQVSRGSVVYIPAGLVHSYKSTGKEDFEFICVVPNEEDKIEFVN